MSSNYEWQKFQAGERVQARRREAEAHRQARGQTPRPTLALPFSMALLIGVALVVWLLAGCTSPPALLTAAPARVISWAEMVAAAGHTPAQRHEADQRLLVAVGRERFERGRFFGQRARRCPFLGHASVTQEQAIFRR